MRVSGEERKSTKMKQIYYAITVVHSLHSLAVKDGDIEEKICSKA